MKRTLVGLLLGAAVLWAAAPVPAGGTKRVQLLVPADIQGLPAIQLLAGQEQVAEVTPDLQTPTTEVLVGVLGVTAADLPALAGQPVGDRTVRVVELTADDLPAEPAALQGLDALLLDRFAWGELPEPQRLALQAWVEHGGRLLVATGPEVRRLEGLSPWIPVTLGPVSTVDLPGIGRAPLADLGLPPTDTNWQVRYAAGGRALAGRYRKGMGQVVLLHFDPSLEPFASWPGLGDLLAAVLPQSANPAAAAGNAGGMGARLDMQLLDTLNQVPLREVPAVRGLLLLLVGYAVVIGPVHFLLLRGFRRTGWAVLTLPLLATLGGGAAYAYTQQAHRSTLAINTLTVIEGQPDSAWWKVQGLAGFFMPPASSHTVSVGDALLAPVPSLFQPDVSGGPVREANTLLEGARSARLEPADQWRLHGLRTEATVPAPGTVSGSLFVDKAKLVGRVTNHLPFALKDAILVSGTTFHRLGDMEPGDSMDVSLLQPAFASQFGGDNPLAEVLARAVEFNGFRSAEPSPAELEQMRRQQMAWAAGQVISWTRAAQRPEAVIIGWTDHQPLPVTVNGREAPVDSLTLYAQPLRVGVGEGEFALPATWSVPRLVAWNSLAPAQYLMPGWTLAQGDSLQMEFEVPVHLADRVTEVEWKLPALNRTRDGKYPLAVQFFRWADGTWQTANPGVDGAVAKAEGMVSPAGAVRVQVTQVYAEPIPLGVPGLAIRGKGVAR
jgi:hypothetical protein